MVQKLPGAKNAYPGSSNIMSSEQFDCIVEAIIEGKYSWVCVLILRFAGYNPAHYIPYRTYKRLIRENRQRQIVEQSAQPSGANIGNSMPMEHRFSEKMRGLVLAESKAVFARVMSPEQFDCIVKAILEGKYSWVCVLILRFAGYNPAHYIPYRTYKRLIRENRQRQIVEQSAQEITSGMNSSTQTTPCFPSRGDLVSVEIKPRRIFDP